MQEYSLYEQRKRGKREGNEESSEESTATSEAAKRPVKNYGEHPKTAIKRYFVDDLENTNVAVGTNGESAIFACYTFLDQNTYTHSDFLLWQAVSNENAAMTMAMTMAASDNHTTTTNTTMMAVAMAAAIDEDDDGIRWQR